LLSYVDFHVVEFDVIDVGYFIECGRRRGSFMTGPQLAETRVQFIIVFDIVFHAAARRCLAWAIFPRAAASFAGSTSLAVAARGARFAITMGALLQLWPLIAGRTFRNFVVKLGLRFHVRLADVCFHTRFETDFGFRFGRRLRRPLHAKLAKHASPVITAFRR
jgi:hypothetical protein